MARHWLCSRHGNVWIYIPNLIGYARVISTITAFFLASKHPTTFVVLYFLGFVADETDGRFARKYQQTSTLGAVLDMVTDRVSTAGLLMLLCKSYPRYFVLFLLLLHLDISSHWFQMYSTLVAGNRTHKDVASHSLLVRLYYQHRFFMGFCCISCEVLYLMAFSNHRMHRMTLLSIWSALVICIVYRSFNALHHHPGLALCAISPGVQGGRVAAVVLLAWAALPGVLTKQFVNCVQLRNAMASLVLHDQQKASTPDADIASKRQ